MKIPIALTIIWFSPMSLFAQPSETGTAARRSPQLQGALTAFGETYEDSDFTGSSRAFAWNDLVRVTRTDNQQSVIIRINDRLSGDGDRAIELSAAAADHLDISTGDRTPVTITLVEAGAGQLILQRLEQLSWTGGKRPIPMKIDGRTDQGYKWTEPLSVTKSMSDSEYEHLPSYAVQLGAFSSEQNAKTFSEEISRKHGLHNVDMTTRTQPGGQQLVIVVTGGFDSYADAAIEAERLRSTGIQALPVKLLE